MSDVIEQDGWTIHWRLSESAGLLIYLASFRGRRVLWEGSLPYVTVDHQRENLSLEDGGTDSHGPFWMPLGGRSITGAIRKSDFRGGFELAADFDTGASRYTQMWRFHQDGRLGPWLVIHGGGLHDGHTYHPHWRFDFDVASSREDALEHFEAGRWQRVREEGWIPYTGETDDDGLAWRQIDVGTGALIGIRPHAWEDAELFAIRNQAGEWPPFSPRATGGWQPFPAAYVGAEPIDGVDVTLWYVAHVHHDGAFPFTAGPLIRCHGF
jgi:hypothetical protein